MMLAPMIAKQYCDEKYGGSGIEILAHTRNDRPNSGVHEGGDDDDVNDGSLCALSERCVSSCAAYGRVCPCAARAAAQAVHEKTSKITMSSEIFKDGPPDFNRIAIDDIVLGEKLGEGGFSLVKSCLLKTDDHMASKENAYAVKYLKRKIMVEMRHFRHGAADLATEAYFLGVLNHPNIVQLLGVAAGNCESNVASGKDCGFFIVVDRLQETLDHRIETWKKELEAQPSSLFYRLSKDYKEKQKSMLGERLRVAIDIATAMEYLHSLNVAYRDLKPDNVGFAVDGTLKLFDFGLAKEEKSVDSDENGTFKMTGQTGSRRYMAPEVAQDRSYNKSVDVYSFGILLWEICCLQKPFAGYTSKKHMVHVVLGGERPPMDSSLAHHWPADLQELMKRCWSTNSNLRPSFGEVKSALNQIIESCSVSCPEKAKRNSTGMSLSSEGKIKPPPGGFASMKPARGDRRRGHTVGSALPSSNPTSERRHWSFGFVHRSNPSNP